ncbi:MAG: hypothetical protein AB1942_21450 [Pseudomonadota bacterium]
MRRRDAFLGLPLVSIAGVVASTVRDLAFGWSVLWMAVGALPIVVYLGLEHWRPRR